MNNNGHAVSPPSQPALRPAAQAPGEGETTVYRTLRVLRRRGWLLLAVWVATVGMGGAYAVTRPAAYRSEATIEVGSDTPTNPADLFGEISGHSSPPWENHFRTQETLLRRPGLLAAVLAALPPESTAEYRQSSDPVRKLSERLDILAVRSTFLIRISIDHDDREHGPEIVNKLVELFIEDSNSRLREMKSGALDVLNEETLPEIRRKVEESEQRVNDFEIKAGCGDISERYASLLAAKHRVSEKLFEVRVRIIGLKYRPEPRAEDLGEAALPFATDSESLMGGTRSLEALGARRAELEAELGRQKAVLKDKHATIVSLREQLAAVERLIETSLKASARNREAAVQAAIRRVEMEQAAAADEERALTEEEKRVDSALAIAREQDTRFRRLDAEAATARDLHNSYLKKQVELKAISGAGAAGVRVVDLAIAPQRYRRNTQLIVTLAALLGLLFGSIAVLIAEQHDDRVTTPDEAEAALGLDVLVSVPHLPCSAKAKGNPVVPEDLPDQSPLDPFRRLRSVVVSRLQGIEGSKVVAVAGPGYGEGKTTVAVNLARTLGLEGRRVLLFDADFRHPRLKALFGSPLEPGLEEFLRTEGPLGRSVQPTTMPGVDVLGASQGLIGSSELPVLDRFRDLWSEVRSYDYVIVDAGPVNAFSETAGVASQADACILVMDEGVSALREVASARKILEHQGIRILGLVVNRSQSVKPAGTRTESRGIFTLTGRNNQAAVAHAGSNGGSENGNGSTKIR